VETIHREIRFKNKLNYVYLRETKPIRESVFICPTVTTTSFFIMRNILRQDFWCNLLHKDQQPSADTSVLQTVIPGEKGAREHQTNMLTRSMAHIQTYSEPPSPVSMLWKGGNSAPTSRHIKSRNQI
jgi:hypothetical protein